MSEYELKQNHVDEIVTRAINGEIPKEDAIKAQQEFEEWKSVTLIGDVIDL